MRHNDESNQLGLDFTSSLNERIARVRSMETALVSEVGPKIAECVIDLLTRIILCGDDNGVSHARVVALAAKCDGRRTVNETTIRRWTRSAIELGLLEVQDRSHQFGGALPNRWVILWPRVRELSQGRASEVQKQTPLTREGGGHQPGMSRASCPPRGGHHYRPTVFQVSSSRNPTPTPPSNTEAAPSASTATWGQVVVELEKIGLKLRDAFIVEAKQRGLSPFESLEMLHEYQANSRLFSSPGAITFRLRNGTWPTAGKVTTAAEVRAAAQRKAEQLALRDRQEAERRIEQADDASRKALLESQYGGQLDSLSQVELEELRALALDNFLLQIARRNPKSTLVRERLLTALASKVAN